jgi:hypothetical protein
MLKDKSSCLFGPTVQIVIVWPLKRIACCKYTRLMYSYIKRQYSFCEFSVCKGKALKVYNLFEIGCISFQNYLLTNKFHGAVSFLRS